MSSCPHHRAAAPRHPTLPWCARHQFHLDSDGRLCARCQRDPAWRNQLALVDAARCHAARPDENDPPENTAFYCPRFDTPADPALCRQCRVDPELRAFLAAQARVRRAMPHADSPRNGPCLRRGPPVGQRDVLCCGGLRRSLPLYDCPRHGRILDVQCIDCPDFQRSPPHDLPPPPSALE